MENDKLEHIRKLLKFLPKDYSELIYQEIKDVESNYQDAKQKEK